MGNGASPSDIIGKNYLNFLNSDCNLDSVDNDFYESTNQHMLASQLARYFGNKGPIATVCSACATGQIAVQEAYKKILMDDADIMIAGTSCHVLEPWVIKGLQSIGALNEGDNNNPDGASRPFDDSRNGLIPGSGGNCLILEELDHALERNAKIYGEISGYSINTDGYHLIRPHPDGLGLFLSMRNSI